MDSLKLSIFEEKAVANGERIFVKGIQEEVREICKELGGVTKASQLLGLPHSCVREWPYRGKPVSLRNLNRLLGFLSLEKKLEYQGKIDSKEIFLGGRYSALTMQFPKILSKELAYIAGIILGDGTLSGETKKKKRAWNVGAIFDNKEHAIYYNSTVFRIFKIEGHTRKNKDKNCVSDGFGSIVVHWFFRSYFDFHTGYKAHKIEIPNRVLQTKNPELINSCLRGLFDSDGTIIPSKKEVKYASVSKTIVDQVSKILQENGMKVTRCQWLKNPKYRMLYDVRISGIQNLLQYSRLIGFNHPEKQKKLYNLLGEQSILVNSPVVQWPSTPRSGN